MPNKAIFYHRGYFNSRPREGGDGLALGVCHFVNISIHAPAKGATRQIGFHGTGGYFNSRPREGGDKMSLQRLLKTLYFNSRPREGGDSSG